VTAPISLITGAGSGIGRASATLLSSRGHCLILVGRRADALHETATLLPTPALELPADIADPAQPGAIIRAALAKFGRLDNLINNAGHAPLVPLERHTPDLIQSTFAVNAIAPANLIAAAWPTFLAQRSGCIVNLSSIGIDDPFPGLFAYAAAKGAVSVMARSCHAEGAERGIRAFAIAPECVETPMLRSIVPESVRPRSTTIAPERIAQLILDCIEGRNDYRAGDTIRIMPEA
jgi:NAD(P)-dependent dehydrogenase (short-subunit alcohol dehydrogenase family)